MEDIVSIFKQNHCIKYLLSNEIKKISSLVHRQCTEMFIFFYWDAGDKMVKIVTFLYFHFRSCWSPW